MKLRTVFFGGCACIVTLYLAYQVGTGMNEATSGPSPSQVADHAAKVKAAIQKQQVFVGMTPAEAEASWGKPKRVNRTTTAQGTREQWVYQSDSYLTFENDKLVAIQN
ncbi:MAG TPA: hypothetical protein VFF76_10525 [Holophagaceae bacterium]|jgi:hypothetical protein|nr:hypothetical protein [Holophagaceae bacterium]